MASPAPWSASTSNPHIASHKGQLRAWVTLVIAVSPIDVVWHRVRPYTGVARWTTGLELSAKRFFRIQP